MDASPNSLQEHAEAGQRTSPLNLGMAIRSRNVPIPLLCDWPLIRLLLRSGGLHHLSQARTHHT
jgi:hypothetical protein